jgi:myo-inositol 2-dehydrogenase/D-chiro-inositol 1-dehydrogenase
MTSTIGVGFLGCGPVTQAIHLPTLERTPRLRVVRMMDVDPAVAESVADRVGSAWTTDDNELINDPAVDIVVVCSPNAFHAEQVIAACRAGKKAVLCEKPLAMSEAEAREVAAVSAATGVPVVVGAMHTFDPGWLAALERWDDLVAETHTLRYSITLPPNPRFEDFASVIVGRPRPWVGGEFDADAAAGMIAGSVMGLAIHDLPLIRMFCPDWAETEVLSAQAIRSGGYLIHLRIGERSVRVFGVMTDSMQPEWRLEAIGDTLALDVAFQNSYVHAGSATSVVREAGRAQVFGPYPANGYEAEWNYLIDLVDGRADPVPVDRLVDDVAFALRIAEAASSQVRASFDSKLEVTR